MERRQHNPDIIKAMTLAHIAHAGQMYSDSEPYFHAHLAKVAANAEALAKQAGQDPTKYVMVAWLHDSVEDTAVTEAFLRKDHYPEDVIQGILAMTKDPSGSESNDDYLKRVKANPLARLVKQADLMANLAASGKPHLKDKYRKSLAFLQE